MDLLGSYKTWMLYRNNAGFIEAYKPKGNTSAGGNSEDLERVVTMFTTTEEFINWTNRKRRSKIPPPKLIK